MDLGPNFHPNTIVTMDFRSNFHPNTIALSILGLIFIVIPVDYDFWSSFQSKTIDYGFWSNFHPNTIHCDFVLIFILILYTMILVLFCS